MPCTTFFFANGMATIRIIYNEKKKPLNTKHTKHTNEIQNYTKTLKIHFIWFVLFVLFALFVCFVFKWFIQTEIDNNSKK